MGYFSYQQGNNAAGGNRSASGMPPNGMVPRQAGMANPPPGYGSRQQMPSFGQYGMPYAKGWGFQPPGANVAASQQQQQQQANPGYDLIQQLGLGNFYTPYQAGQAQNVPNSGPMANFIGSYLPNSTVGGIGPGGYSQRQPSGMLYR
jgi:hypothetical protein